MTSKAANPSKKRRKTENMTDEEKRERRCATFSCAQQLRYHALGPTVGSVLRAKPACVLGTNYRERAPADPRACAASLPLRAQAVPGLARG